MPDGAPNKFVLTEGSKIRLPQKDSPSGGVVIEGRALPFGKISRNGVRYRQESIEKTHKDLVGRSLLFNHDVNWPTGHVLEAWIEKDDGLYYRADVNPGIMLKTGTKLVDSIKRGDISNVSISVIPNRETVEEITEDSNDIEVDVVDWIELSIVTTPGFKDTSMSVRELVDIARSHREKVVPLEKETDVDCDDDEDDEKLSGQSLKHHVKRAHLIRSATSTKHGESNMRELSDKEYQDDILKNIKEIKIRQEEGGPPFYGKWFSFSKITDVEAHLIRGEKPDKGYNKHKVIVTLKDGTQITNFRYDHGKNDPSFGKQFEYYCKNRISFSSYPPTNSKHGDTTMKKLHEQDPLPPEEDEEEEEEEAVEEPEDEEPEDEEPIEDVDPVPDEDEDEEDEVPPEYFRRIVNIENILIEDVDPLITRIENLEKAFVKFISGGDTSPSKLVRRKERVKIGGQFQSVPNPGKGKQEKMDEEAVLKIFTRRMAGGN